MVTCDALLRGRIRVWQPERGHRVTMDSLLLADFARGGGGERILDLGCGTGVVILALLADRPSATGVGLELQAELVELARRNIGENGLDGRLHIEAGDVRTARLGETFDVVVCNPPFYDARSRAAAEEARALARHDGECTLEDVAAAMRRHVAPKGRGFLVYPAERLAAVFTAGLPPVRTLRFVHSLAGEPARRVLVEVAPGWKGGVTVAAPLVVHTDDRKTHTEEAARILGGPSADGGAKLS